MILSSFFIRLCILNSLYDAEKEKKKKTSRILMQKLENSTFPIPKYNKVFKVKTLNEAAKARVIWKELCIQLHVYFSKT